MSQERQREAPVSETDEPSAAKPHQRLPSLISAAVIESDPTLQRQLVTELIELLIAMRAPGDEADEARLLVAQLDAKSLSGLVDAQGRSAHTEAVETLLSLGFPHALQVSPEDLKRFRDDREGGTLGGEALAVDRARTHAMWVALAAQGAGLTWGLAFDEKALPMAALSALFGVSGALWLRAIRPSDGDTGPLGVIALSAMIAALAATSSATQWGVTIALFAALFVARKPNG